MMAFRNAVCCLALLLTISISALPQNTENDIQTLYAEAKSAEQANHLDEAIEKYRAILKVDSKLAAAYNNLGRLYLQQNRFDDAAPVLKRACELAPASAVPHALLGLALFQKRDFASAQREFRTTLRLNPNDSNAKLYLAKSLIATGDSEPATKLLEDLKKKDPHNVEVLYTLGTLYSSLAAATLSEVQASDPGSYLVEVLLGKASEAKQILPDAVEHYKRAIAKAPENAELYYLYAHSLWASGNFNDALTAYRECLGRAPYNPDANWEAARILVDRDPAQALRLVNRALDLKAEGPDLYMVQGRALMLLQRPKDAVDAFRKASALDPDDGAPHFQLARAYRQLGLLAEASNEDAAFEKMQKESHALKEDKLGKQN